MSNTRTCQIGDFNPLSDSSARLSHAGLSEAEQSHIVLGFGMAKSPSSVKLTESCRLASVTRLTKPEHGAMTRTLPLLMIALLAGCSTAPSYEHITIEPNALATTCDQWDPRVRAVAPCRTRTAEEVLREAVAQAKPGD